jgi:hypothetical protein
MIEKRNTLRKDWTAEEGHSVPKSEEWLIISVKRETLRVKEYQGQTELVAGAEQTHARSLRVPNM